MSTPGTPKASPSAVAAVQEALAFHPRRLADDGSDWECYCGETFANYGLHQAHVALAAAEAAALARIPERLQGDGPCSRCAGPVISGWFTDSVFWNSVVRSEPLPWMTDTEHPEGDGFMCFECFVLLANERGFRPTGWRISPEWPWRRADGIEASRG